MSNMNDSQRMIAETTEGMVVVDAGPGTGKTFTIVQRYVNILKKDVNPNDILLLTFTRNAANEMGERIKSVLQTSMGSEEDISQHSRFVETSTFDAFCYAIVMESPDVISDFFRLDDKLTRNARLQENETLNKDFFNRMYDEFVNNYGDDYGNIAALACDSSGDLYHLINKLMSKGIIPLGKGWFGGNDGDDLYGTRKALLDELINLNLEGKLRTKDSVKKDKNDSSLRFPFNIDCLNVPEEFIDEAVNDNISELLRFIHDVYFEYIKKSVSENRLTFGLVSTFAFVSLYSSEETRKRMSHRYVIVDEFQDTNASQMMICLMLLKEPNFCVVGDWKQGIYGFRYVSVDNIINFEERCVRLRRFLNDDVTRIKFQIPEVQRMYLDTNYRSSSEVIDISFRSLTIPATKDEVMNPVLLENIKMISAGREDIGENTEVTFMSAKSKDDEVSATLCRIDEYVNSGKYLICDRKTGEKRKPVYGDIAILCRNNKFCRAIRAKAEEVGIPVFLQGDVDTMSTREGKLALAWMRYVNNPKDNRGPAAILADMGYTLKEIKPMFKYEGREKVEYPEEITEQWKKLRPKKRRINDLLTSIFAYYGLNNDITQSIISTISSLHRNSLLTIPDIIRLMEDDINNNTGYSVDALLNKDAVIIQTMHKSKGLEYPIVIIAGVDQHVIPNYRSESGVFTFNDKLGIRCRKEYRETNGYHDIGNSWKWNLLKKANENDYDEQRRLLFVALSRAEQYLTLISGSKPSSFFKGLLKEGDVVLDTSNQDIRSIVKPAEELIQKPNVPDIKPRKMNLSVHDLMRASEGFSFDSESFSGGKGAQYGTRVHAAAELMAKGIKPRENLPELEEVSKILDNLKDAEILTEVECCLPVDKVMVRGIIDLIAIYPDRIEIHDYKTDEEKENEDEYRIQLTVYGLVAQQCYPDKPVECFIDYVSRKESVSFSPLDMKVIEDRVKLCISEAHSPSLESNTGEILMDSEIY